MNKLSAASEKELATDVKQEAATVEQNQASWLLNATKLRTNQIDDFWRDEQILKLTEGSKFKCA